jgi:hypothetical protein
MAKFTRKDYIETFEFLADALRSDRSKKQQLVASLNKVIPGLVVAFRHFRKNMEKEVKSKIQEATNPDNICLCSDDKK